MAHSIKKRAQSHPRTRTCSAHGPGSGPDPDRCELILSEVGIVNELCTPPALRCAPLAEVGAVNDVCTPAAM